MIRRTFLGACLVAVLAPLTLFRKAAAGVAVPFNELPTEKIIRGRSYLVAMPRLVPTEDILALRKDGDKWTCISFGELRVGDVYVTDHEEITVDRCTADAVVVTMPQVGKTDGNATFKVVGDILDRGIGGDSPWRDGIRIMKFLRQHTEYKTILKPGSYAQATRHSDGAYTYTFGANCGYRIRHSPDGERFRQHVAEMWHDGVKKRMSEAIALDHIAPFQPIV